MDQRRALIRAAADFAMAGGAVLFEQGHSLLGDRGEGLRQGDGLDAGVAGCNPAPERDCQAANDNGDDKQFRCRDRLKKFTHTKTPVEFDL